MEGKMFGCCNGWVECGGLGYCVHADSTYALTFCQLCQNLFVLEKPCWKETWKQSSYSALCKMSYLPPQYIALKEYLEDPEANPQAFNQEANDAWWRCVHEKRVQRENPKPIAQPNSTAVPQEPYRKGQTVRHFYEGLQIILTEEGRLHMNGITVVAEKGNFQLFKWMFRDLIHYGIRMTTTGEVVEKFTPNALLKGFQLKKHAEEKLATYSDDLVAMPEEARIQLKTIDVLAVEVYIDDILVHWNPTKEKYVFGLVVNETENCFFTRTPEGKDSLWSKISLQQKLDEGVMRVMHKRDVPAEITWPLTGHL